MTIGKKYLLARSCSCPGLLHYQVSLPPFPLQARLLLLGAKYSFETDGAMRRREPLISYIIALPVAIVIDRRTDSYSKLSAENDRIAIDKTMDSMIYFS